MRLNKNKKYYLNESIKIHRNTTTPVIRIYIYNLYIPYIIYFN